MLKLLVYKTGNFPDDPLVVPDCAESKRLCKNESFFSIRRLKQLEKEGYTFQCSEIKKTDWQNGSGLPVGKKEEKYV